MKTKEHKAFACPECRRDLCKTDWRILGKCPGCGTLKDGTQPRRDPIQSRKKRGLEVQTWGIDAAGNAVTAGVYFVHGICAKEIVKIFRHWNRWRRWYKNLPRQRMSGYHNAPHPDVAHYGAHPIDDPKAMTWINVSMFQTCPPRLF